MCNLIVVEIFDINIQQFKLSRANLGEQTHSAQQTWEYNIGSTIKKLNEIWSVCC